jgi:hypothetical protein
MLDEEFDVLAEDHLALLSKRFKCMYENHKNARRSSVMCYRCGKSGHFIIKCPEAMEVKNDYKSRPRNNYKDKHYSWNNYTSKHKNKSGARTSGTRARTSPA